MNHIIKHFLNKNCNTQQKQESTSRLAEPRQEIQVAHTSTQTSRHKANKNPNSEVLQTHNHSPILALSVCCPKISDICCWVNIRSGEVDFNGLKFVINRA